MHLPWKVFLVSHRSVVSGAVGTQVHNGTVREHFVIYIGWEHVLEREKEAFKQRSDDGTTFAQHELLLNHVNGNVHGPYML